MRRFPRYTTLAWKSLLVLPIFAVAVLAVVAGPTSNGAHIMATGPLTISGYVYDLAGNPLEGANVVVLIVQTSFTASATTGADGSYQALPDIPPASYDLGNTIQVTATYNSAEEQVSVPVTQDMIDFGMAQIDVHYTYEIPEFGTGFGFAFVMVVIAALAVVVLGRKTLS